jgi:hypothetical protein
VWRKEISCITDEPGLGGYVYPWVSQFLKWAAKAEVIHAEE